MKRVKNFQLLKFILILSFLLTTIYFTNQFLTWGSIFSFFIMIISSLMLSFFILDFSFKKNGIYSTYCYAFWNFIRLFMWGISSVFFTLSRRSWNGPQFNTRFIACCFCDYRLDLCFSFSINNHDYNIQMKTKEYCRGCLKTSVSA